MVGNVFLSVAKAPCLLYIMTTCLCTCTCDHAWFLVLILSNSSTYTCISFVYDKLSCGCGFLSFFRVVPAGGKNTLLTNRRKSTLANPCHIQCMSFIWATVCAWMFVSGVWHKIQETLNFSRRRSRRAKSWKKKTVLYKGGKQIYPSYL